MEQKIVPFKVAKAIKEAGYPQSDTLEYGAPFYASTNSKMYGIDEHERIYPIAKAKPTKLYRIGEHCISNKKNFILAPTYLDVWLWLWREKHVFLECNSYNLDCLKKDGWKDIKFTIRYDNGYGPESGFMSGCQGKDPEEVIVAAIDFLVDNNLIK